MLHDHHIGQDADSLIINVSGTFALQDKVHPQTIAVLQSRADGLGLTVEVGNEAKFNVDKDVSGVLVQYPATDGTVHDYKVCVLRIILLMLIMELCFI